MPVPKKRKRRGKAIGFAALVVLLFGSLLLLMWLIKAVWAAYVVLAVALCWLLFVRKSFFWRGWRALLCWALALAVAGSALILGRPSLSTSFSATLQREGRRALYQLMRSVDQDYFVLAARFAEDQRDWQPPKGYTHSETALPNSTLEFVEGEKPSGKLVYQLHGGAYIIPLDNRYRDMAVRLSKTAKEASVALLNYRVAPQHLYPAALQDALDGWDHLLSLGYEPGDILVVGDSAGGNLALSLCLYLRDEGRELPSGIIAISPWADLAEEGGSYTYNLYNDPSFGLVKGERLEFLGIPVTYAGAEDLHTPYLSPVYGSYEGFPPMLITVGSWELLESDSLTIAEKARRAGVEVTLVDAEGLFHIYPVVAAGTPEGRQAWEAIGQFMQENFV